MIFRTAYLVSCASSLIFLTLDWLRPGFVSNFLSPHLFLLSAIIFGVLSCRQSSRPVSLPSSPRRGWGWCSAVAPILVCLTIGLLLALFTWVEGRALGDMRILVTIVAFLIPWLVGHLLTYKD